MIKMNMQGDQPSRTSTGILNILNKKEYVALSKLDGWRVRIIIDDDVLFISKSGRELPVHENIKNAMNKLITDGKIPNKSIIDGEWMKYRASSGNTPGFDGPECIYPLSPLYLEGTWVGNLPFMERWQWINSLGLPIDDLSIHKSDQMPNNPLIIPASSNEFTKFYELHKKVIRTEGLVIYKLDGHVYGSIDGSIKSKNMMKCKYREGSDGRNFLDNRRYK